MTLYIASLVALMAPLGLMLATAVSRLAGALTPTGAASLA